MYIIDITLLCIFCFVSLEMVKTASRSYHLSTYQGDYDGAKQACLDEGMQLAVIIDQDDVDAVIAAIAGGISKIHRTCTKFFESQ